MGAPPGISCTKSFTATDLGPNDDRLATSNTSDVRPPVGDAPVRGRMGTGASPPLVLPSGFPSSLEDSLLGTFVNDSRFKPSGRELDRALRLSAATGLWPLCTSTEMSSRCPPDGVRLGPGLAPSGVGESLGEGMASTKPK